MLGLGNPILGDDGVGWRVAEAVKEQLPPNASVDVDCVSLGGIGLMERMIGCDRAIIVDAFASDEPLGACMVLKLEDLPNYFAFHTTSVHDTSLQTAIELGRSMGAPLPRDILLVGISTKPIRDFSEELSPPVAEAVPQAARIVLGLILRN